MAPWILRRRAFAMLAASVLAGALLAPGRSSARERLRPLADLPRESFPSQERDILRAERVDLHDAVRRFGGLKPGGLLTFNLFADTAFDGTVERVVRREADSFTYHGSLTGSGPGFFQVTVHRGAVFVVLRAANRSFEIRSVEGGDHEIRELDSAAASDRGCEMLTDPPPSSLGSPPGNLPDDGEFIDILVMYSAAARAVSGGQDAIEAAIYGAVDQANDAYSRSGISPRLRLVGRAFTSYEESGDCSTDLQRLAGFDGFMDEAHTLRDASGADLVHFICHGNSGCCGVAYLLNGFALTQATCLSNFTFAHEVGHNLGCCHAPGDGGGCSQGGVFPFSVGHRFTGASGQVWRTVMAYLPGERIPHFSNPSRTWDWRATGVPGDGFGGSDNARTTNLTTPTVANFRPQGCGSGPKGMTLLAPVEGAALCPGIVETVSWTNSHASLYFVVLELSTDGGGTWTTTAEGTGQGGSGSLAWTVPYLPTTRGRIRVRLWNCAGSSSDSSTADFAILSDPTTPTLTSPNGGESLCPGGITAVTWADEPRLCPVAGWEIHYSSDGGSTFAFSGSGSGDPGGSVDWQVPATPTTRGRLRLTVYCGGVGSDVGDGNFTIVGEPVHALTSPNGGEVICAGSQFPITWDSETCANSWRLEYTTDGAFNWFPIAFGPGDGSGSYLWSVPEAAAPEVQLRLTLENGLGPIRDESDAAFRIATPPAPTVVRPAGGDIWVAGSRHAIRWSQGGETTGHALRYSTDGGASWLPIVAETPGDGGGNYAWQVPDATKALVEVALTGPCGKASATNGGELKIAAPGAFVDVASGALTGSTQGSGIAWVDFDADGDEDVFLSSLGGIPHGSRLLENDGFGDFAEVTPASLVNLGTAVFATTWADYDNDGDADAFLAISGGPDRLMRNDGGLAFADVTPPALADPGDGHSAAWADYDRDGDADLYIANFGQANRLVRNDGGTFTDVTAGPLGSPGFTSVAAWADADLDGDPDLYLARIGPNALLRNDGGGTFADVSAGPVADPGAGFGASWGDYDNDGDPDLYIANAGPNVLLRNDGGMAFTNVTEGVLGDAGAAAGTAWTDLDLDGDLDLYVANQGQANRVLRNDGGVFADATSGAAGDAGQARGVAAADVDGNGHADLLLVNVDSPNRLFLNFSNGSHWLGVRLAGTTSNRSAIGAKVRVATDATSQHREVSTGAGCLSQGSLVQMFGLGPATQADLVEVSWPSGVVQIVRGVAADQVLDLVEADQTAAPEGAGARLPQDVRLHPCAPNPFRDVAAIRYDLPRDGRIDLRVYDVLGRLVKVLVRGHVSAGVHEARWDRRDSTGGAVAAGVYFVRLETSERAMNGKVVVLPSP